MTCSWTQGLSFEQLGLGLKGLMAISTLGFELTFRLQAHRPNPLSPTPPLGWEQGVFLNATKLLRDV